MPLTIDVLTLFPGIFDGYLQQSLLKKAIDAGLVSVHLWNFRDWAADRHKSVDDAPYGGGAGMVMRPEPLFAAIEPLREAGAHVVLLDPAGERLTDGLARLFGPPSPWLSAVRNAGMAAVDRLPFLKRALAQPALR